LKLRANGASPTFELAAATATGSWLPGGGGSPSSTMITDVALSTPPLPSLTVRPALKVPGDE
jgi:hypothetical protein